MKLATSISCALVASALALALAGCGPRTEGLDPAKIPAELRADHDLFSRKCAKCHSLARPLNAGFTDDEQWRLYVTRMRRQPASGISPDDQEHILRFLYWYASELRAKKVASDAPPAAASGSALPRPTPPPVDVDGGAP
jgi:hypothetical protein